MYSMHKYQAKPHMKGFLHKPFDLLIIRLIQQYTNYIIIYINLLFLVIISSIFIKPKKSSKEKDNQSKYLYNNICNKFKT